ncbi:MAG: T9SS type A sorting domain-containing protein [Flavobacteriales bacterium]|nr:T9SS type A sorting domain-containing protein [Flavobacteriales bacterium]
MKHAYVSLAVFLIAVGASAQKPGSITANELNVLQEVKAIQGTVVDMGQRGGGPANDECAAAISVTVGTVCEPINGSLDGATQSVAPATCSGFTASAANDVWYSFVATAASTTVQVTGGGDNTTGVDPVLEVYAGSCADLASLGCVDATLRGAAETLLVTTTPGATYYYRVYYWPYTAAQTVFDFTTCVFAIPAPWNDDCATPMPLVPGATCVQVGFSTTGATESLPSIDCGGFTSPNALDVWFSFVATATDHTVGVFGPNEADAMVEIFSGDCGSLVSLGCEDSTFPMTAGEATTENLVQSGLTVGTTYYVRVYDWGHFSDDHFFEICVTEGSGTNVGINELSWAAAWSVFPNPADGSINLSYAGANSMADIEVLDVTGRLVHADRIGLASGAVVPMDVTNLGAGTYVIRFAANGERTEKRFVVK